MDLQAVFCVSGAGTIPWLPIRKKELVVADLVPGVYYLRNRFVSDQFSGLCVDKEGEGWRRLSWTSTKCMEPNSKDSEDESPCSIEEVQYNLLETVIMDKIKVLHDETDYENILELQQNINGLVLMGFDYYAHDSSCTTLAGDEHLVNFFMKNPCLFPVIGYNASPTPSQTGAPETEDIPPLRKCFVRVRRLEDELPAELVEKLWRSYNSYEESIKRETDDDEDSNVAPPTKRRPGRPRKQESKSSLKKKYVKYNYRVSSESSSENYTTDDECEGEDTEDEDYVPFGKRRTTNYGLRRRN